MSIINLDWTSFQVISSLSGYKTKWLIICIRKKDDNIPASCCCHYSLCLSSMFLFLTRWISSSSSASVRLGRRWCSSIIWAYLHFLEWLCRPTREWQSLPHLVQEKGVGCWGYLPRSFRLLLLSKAAVVSASSANFAACLTVCLQDGRSSAMLSHELLSMLHRFMSLLQTSLKRSLGRPACREPSTSSPYKRSLGMRPGSILLTWPNQWSRLSQRMV